MTMVFLDGDLLGAWGAGAGRVTVVRPWLLRPSTTIFYIAATLTTHLKTFQVGFPEKIEYS